MNIPWLRKRGSAPDILHLRAATGAQTVTIQRLTPSGDVRVCWGDGGISTVASGYTGTVTHAYAAAGVYTIAVEGASRITGLDLQDTKLGGLNTAELRSSRLTHF